MKVKPFKINKSIAKQTADTFWLYVCGLSYDAKTEGEKKTIPLMDSFNIKGILDVSDILFHVKKKLNENIKYEMKMYPKILNKGRTYWKPPIAKG